MKRAPTFSNTPTIQWTGFRGARRLSRKPRRNKLVFLSVGYSTCHWCHVMKRESFDDDDVARMINQNFVPIKVDKEERPDIDNLYMAVCQMISGNCGWPLTVIMTPDKKPFFAGTYFPKETRGNHIGMTELIPRLEELWMTRPEEILKSANEITATLKRLTFSERNCWTKHTESCIPTTCTSLR